MPVVADQDPLASASLRYFVRPTPQTSRPSEPATRPFSLRHAVAIARPVPMTYRYNDVLQVAAADDDDDDKPPKKDWKTKFKSDGDEGEEEEYGWEES